MNLYFRYFAHEVLVSSPDELFDFIATIPEIHITSEMVEDVHRYVESEIPFPKRYKVRPRIYFILIKTQAATMEEFKHTGKTYNTEDPGVASHTRPSYAPPSYAPYSQKKYEEGWYDGGIHFKRVVQNPVTGKFGYEDTFFAAYVWAANPPEVYDRITHYLKERDDVDSRSQFPSLRGENFHAEYIGKELPPEVEATNNEEEEMGAPY